MVMLTKRGAAQPDDENRAKPTITYVQEFVDFPAAERYTVR